MHAPLELVAVLLPRHMGRLERHFPCIIRARAVRMAGFGVIPGGFAQGAGIARKTGGGGVFEDLCQPADAMPRYRGRAHVQNATTGGQTLCSINQLTTDAKMKKILAMLVASMFAAGATYADEMKKEDKKVEMKKTEMKKEEKKAEMKKDEKKAEMKKEAKKDEMKK